VEAYGDNPNEDFSQSSRNKKGISNKNHIEIFSEKLMRQCLVYLGINGEINPLFKKLM